MASGPITPWKIDRQWKQWQTIFLASKITADGECSRERRREYQTTLLASWEICLQVKKQQLELDMEQQSGSKLGMDYDKAVYCHPVYLTYM